MRCMGKYSDTDRICDMCHDTNSVVFHACKSIYDRHDAREAELCEIRSKCPYRGIAMDEYETFYSCGAKERRIDTSRYADSCRCTESCRQYIDEEK